jgi:cytochrome oxidase assembly protein ShyY1
VKPVPRAILLIVAMAVALGCIRLGLWQLERRAEKRARNAALAAALAGPALELGSARPLASRVGGRVVSVQGRFDMSHQVMLAGREHLGSTGVEVVTPLILADGSAVLVNRGWLASQDPATAHPERHPEPGDRTVRALAEPLAHAGRGALTRLPGEPARYLALALRVDSLAARLPYRLSDVVLRELPGPQVPAEPLRTPPAPAADGVHLNYAIQWFAIAAVVLGGSIALAVRGVPGTASGPPAPAHPSR